MAQNPNVFQAVVEEMKGKAPAAGPIELHPKGSLQRREHMEYSPTRPQYYSKPRGEFMSEARRSRQRSSRQHFTSGPLKALDYHLKQAWKLLLPLRHGREVNKEVSAQPRKRRAAHLSLRGRGKEGAPLLA